ncbi:hypothetical protein KKG52_00410 [Patescibacteria group bacterium]|nr:hypothetical protein [Patescibacteria group bacterium]
MPDNNSHYHRLKKKWLSKQRKIEKHINKKHGHHIISLLPKQQLIGGLMLAAIPFTQLAPSIYANVSEDQKQEQRHISPKEVSVKLKEMLPNSVRPLISGEERLIAEFLSNLYHIPISAELEGIKLNRSYGYIGKEQHLRRYPGDNLYEHFDNQNEASLHSPEGVAPGLGAWGYFAPSKEEFTEKDKQREKYYIAVQTFLSPGWEENIGRYGQFFKYKKMLLVNPDNGKAIVVVIGDAGPAQWTGKSLGGSPEVMHFLERVDGSQKGPVLYFFINDPSDTIPLGPLEI